MGALGEAAFCKATDLVWPKRGNQTMTGLPDVDPFWEVRWSSSTRHVKVREAPAEDKRFTDRPELLVAHVTGKPPLFHVWGFILARWAQENVPLEDPGNRGRPSHFVDIRKLSPIDPGFHEVHAWFHHPDGWICLYCGERYE